MALATHLHLATRVKKGRSPPLGLHGLLSLVNFTFTVHITTVKIIAACVHLRVSSFCSTIGCVVVEFVGKTKKTQRNANHVVELGKHTVSDVVCSDRAASQFRSGAVRFVLSRQRPSAPPASGG